MALALVWVASAMLVEAVGAFEYGNDGSHRFGSLVFVHNVLAGFLLVGGLVALLVSLPSLAVVSVTSSRPVRWLATAGGLAVGLVVLALLLGLNPFWG